MKPLLPCLLLFVLLSLHAGKSFSQTKDALPRSTPEMEGVSSGGMDSFLNAAAKSKNEFHSIMFLRHGKVIAEGWWNPYRPDLKHNHVFHQQKFTATAIGFAVSEKRLSINDKVISFFPQYLPDTVSAFLAELTVKDALSMSDGQTLIPRLQPLLRIATG